MRKAPIIFLLFLIFLIQAVAQQKSTILTNKDRILIIKSILNKEDFLNRGLTVDERKEFVNLSLENIAPKLLPKIRGINFVLFNRKQIEEKIKTGFLYYAFGRFKINNSKVLVDFGYFFQNIEGGVDYSGGLTYEFMKVEDKWTGKAINEFSSRTENLKTAHF